MNKNYIATIIVIIAVVLAALLLFMGKKQNVISEKPYNQNPINQNSDNPIPIKQDFTPNIAPEVKITKPDYQIPNNNGKTKSGFFKINISRIGYEPETIAVKKGDLVNIEITSKDGNYDIFLPGTFYLFIPRNETKTLAFETNAYPTGTYNFRCRDYCPVGKIISGSFIILP